MAQHRQPIDMGYGISNGRMMRSQLRTIRRAADNMLRVTVDGDEVPGWLQAQVTISADKMKTSENYLESQLETIKRRSNYGNLPPSQAAILDGDYGEILSTFIGRGLMLSGAYYFILGKPNAFKYGFLGSAVIEAYLMLWYSQK